MNVAQIRQPSNTFWCAECHRQFPLSHPYTVRANGEFGEAVCMDCTYLNERGIPGGQLPKPPRPKPVPLQEERLFDA